MTVSLPIFRSIRRAATTAVLIALAAFFAPGCKDVSRFTSKPGESWCGAVVTGPFVRAGFGPGVRIRMNLDTDHLDDTPGMIATDDVLFDNTPLRPIPQLAHDTLSTLDFGEGRTRNLMFGAHPTHGAAVVVIVSLLENGETEARILRGAALLPGETDTTSPDGPQLFGIFPMTRQQGTCGF